MKIIDFSERFARSLIAGVFSSVILLALNLFSYYVHISNRRFINYSALMIFGREFNNLSEAIISSIAQIGFATGLIVISSYLVLKENRKNYFWRGLFWGFGSWFAIMSIAYIIGIHKILPVKIGAAISLMVTSSIWGVLGAWLLYKLDERYSVKTETDLGHKQRTITRKKNYLSPAPVNKILPKKTVKPKKIG